MDSVSCCRPVRVHLGGLRLLVRSVAVYNILRCGQTGFAFCEFGSSLGLAVWVGASGSPLLAFESKKPGVCRASNFIGCAARLVASWRYTPGGTGLTVTPFFRRCRWQSMLYAG